MKAVSDGMWVTYVEMVLTGCARSPVPRCGLMLPIVAQRARILAPNVTRSLSAASLAKYLDHETILNLPSFRSRFRIHLTTLVRQLLTDDRRSAKDDAYSYFVIHNATAPDSTSPSPFKLLIHWGSANRNLTHICIVLLHDQVYIRASEARGIH
jgi:hypothetical protein